MLFRLLENIEQSALKQKFAKAWDKDTAHPAYQNKYSASNPTAGQCAVTALVLNDMYGYDIYDTVVGRSRHFFNKTPDGDIIDLTAEQFGDTKISYENGRLRNRNDLLKSFDTKQRYELLKSKLGLSEQLHENADDVKISTESIDAYDNQVDMVKKAIIGDRLVGYIQYSIYEDSPHIQMIEVAEKYRRQGIATKLLKSLQSDFPGKSIDTGMRTDDGEKLFKSVSVTKPNKEFARLTKVLEKLKSKDAEIDAYWQKFWDTFDKVTEEEQEKMRVEADSMQDKQDAIRDTIKNIEEKLEDIEESETFIK